VQIQTLAPLTPYSRLEERRSVAPSQRWLRKDSGVFLGFMA
jgi:hypothetical protein